MAKFRMVRTDFWKNPIVSEEMTPEDKYFFLYLLTNHHTTQIGIYKITKKEMAFDTGYSIETIHALMNRMIEHHELIRYNPKTREIAIRNWGKFNLPKGGKPVMDCITAELKEVEDLSLIRYVAECVTKPDMLALYNSYCEMKKDVVVAHVEVKDYENDEPFDDTLTNRPTIGGQKEEKEEEKEKEKQQQQNILKPGIEDIQGEVQAHHIQGQEEAMEIVQFWDENGFGYSNVNAKEQLLLWLEDSTFLKPKEVIMKAMQIACYSNKRRLNYVVGILNNWENESLLTVEEIEKQLHPVARGAM